MNRQEHLLTLLTEECAEVAQRAAKALRFGLAEIQPGQELTNGERIMQEWCDLLGIMAMLQEDASFVAALHRPNPWGGLAKKRQRVGKFLELSRSLGTLCE